ncbi:TIGR03885 family FMN-dependent LLM class oxidoreductase [Isoptericola halotolerans]|uniref:Non-F420 flavinoid oxidoreductase n=1 Tax=Isoptericola halotolerans TaxID=300560 RepID=A0ABX2A3L2_9MICO|nr:putative non-F420 flavinoid oxidoreductase [Isoptericola halotolerans]
MTRFGFHASHEQIAPGPLLDDVRAAERAGFTAAMCSDHFAPWSAAQGESGYAWSWLGAALATTQLPFGVVTAPGQRYHPAVHAQAVATLASMFPGRFWAALGSGQALNEHVTGDPWPRKADREARLRECVDVMRALLAGEEVTHDGRVTVDRARLWSLPEVPPPLLGAAVTPATAGWVGQWADGIITVNQPLDVLREVLDAFRGGGGDGKPAVLQVHVSWAPTDDAARRLAHEQWAPAILGSPVGWLLDLPQELEEIAAYIDPDDMHPHVLASSDPGQHVDWLAELADLGFDEVYVHHVGQQQAPFLDLYGSDVLPALEAV